MSSFNSFKTFSADELSQASPWRLPVMDSGVEPPDIGIHAPEPVCTSEDLEIDAAPMPTAEEIEAIQRQAYEEAAVQGREDGFREGRELGYQDGFEAGRQQAVAEADAALREKLRQLDALLDTFESPLRDLDEEVTEELSALAIALARQLVRRELKTDSGQIVAVVREAMAALPSNARKITLHLHPDDADLVREAMSLEEDGQPWKIQEDPLLSRGGCRVSTENSRIDATVEKRLNAAIAKAFGGEREGDENP